MKTPSSKQVAAKKWADAHKEDKVEAFCNVCCKVVKFLFVRDEGRDEVYQCPHCHCLWRVAVR